MGLLFRQKSKSANTVIYSYENAGHMFSGDGIASEFGMRIRLGGTIEGNEKAGAESEKIVEEFLKEHHGK